MISFFAADKVNSRIILLNFNNTKWHYTKSTQICCWILVAHYQTISAKVTLHFVMAESVETNQTILDLTNATDLLEFFSTSREWMLYQIIWPCFIVFGICTNVSFVWTVIKTPALHTTTYRYLVNLAISDLLFLMVFYIPQIIEDHESPLERNQILQTFIYVFLGCSCLTVTLVSLERFLAICHPIKHHLIKGTRRTNKFICIVWCISLCLTLILYISVNRIITW